MYDQVDLDTVLATEAAYDSAWNAGDVDGLVACFADDAVLVNPRGEIAVGAEEIRARLSSFLHGDAKGSRHTSRAVRVSFVSPDVAVVDGEASVNGAAALGDLSHRFTDILVRQGGCWKIAHVRAYDLQKTEQRSAGGWRPFRNARRRRLQ
jgi:uncharacterized protein (TIGR02246 family)